MSDAVFEQYANQLNLLQIFQLEILQKRITEVLQSRKQAEAKSLENDLALFEHFSGIGAGIDAESAQKAYFEEKYGSSH